MLKYATVKIKHAKNLKSFFSSFKMPAYLAQWTTVYRWEVAYKSGVF